MDAPRGEGLTTAWAARTRAVPDRDRRSRSMNRKAQAVWRGTGKDGDGRLSTDSGVLSNAAYSFKTRFENEKGTNPEELIAAAHAGCFAMALAFELQMAGFNPTELAVDAVVSIEKEGQGFRISRSALTLRAQVPGIEQGKFDELAKGAKANCPVSKVLNAEITLDATLG
jgi:osmotically inducible protein OsmC